MIQRTFVWFVVGAWIAVGSGCSLQSLKESNRRLREHNDRLIAENNRLESDLQRVQQELGEAQVGGRTSEEDAPRPSDGAFADLEGDIEVQRLRDGVRLRLPDRVFFSPGKAALTSKGRQILNRVSEIVAREYRGNTVRVEGHTDDTPTRKVKHIYPTNWELSTARACSVVRYLIENGDVSAQNIYPAGFAFYRPLVEGRSSSARQRNRRVEITILDRTS